MRDYEIHCVSCGDMEANAYLLTKDGKHAVLIDCGGEEVLREAEKLGLEVEAVLLTHGHFDHIGGCGAAQEKGIRIGCSAAEKILTETPELNLSLQTGASVPPFKVDFTFEGGDVLSFAGISLKVISTPGHTEGGVCFRAGDAVFSGDTLFRESIGRTDFPTGNRASLNVSIVKLLTVCEDCDIYPGHGPMTTGAHERAFMEKMFNYRNHINF